VTAAALALLAPPTAAQRDALRATLLQAHAAYPLYRERMAAAEVTPELIRADPLAALARLPPFEPCQIDRLAREALAARAHDLGGVEFSSGTLGPPKRRVLSEEDVARDAALLTELMHRAGVRAGDRVAAVEVGVTSLAVAFLEGCERLGVHATAAIALLPPFDPTPLCRFAPSVLIATPSVLSHVLPCLARGDIRPRLTIYNGDRLPRHVGAALRAAGVGVRSLYGLTETSALGVECPAERGVHLAPHVLAETRVANGAHELVVTPTGFAMPLLRYPTGDRVRVLRGRCPCGWQTPRVQVLGRLGQHVALFDAKFTVGELEALLPEAVGGIVQVVLSSAAHGRERLTVRLPAEARPLLPEIRQRLCAHPQLEFLVRAGLVDLRCAFVEPPLRRKVPRVLDRRRGVSHGGAE
jgi:phenylacetate-CoA ligase